MLIAARIAVYSTAVAVLMIGADAWALIALIPISVLHEVCVAQ